MPALLWTAAGETSDPILLERDLPVDVIGHCLEAAGGEPHATCRADSFFATHWVGRTGDANLFLVRLRPCADTGCRTWLVSKTGRGVNVLFGASGELALSPGAGPYPAVQMVSVLSAGQRVVSRFDWNGHQYTRTDARVIHQVDGRECGSPTQCHEAANEALKTRNVDKALRIWEQVHGVSWI
jgi:hypothetical protein